MSVILQRERLGLARGQSQAFSAFPFKGGKVFGSDVLIELSHRAVRA